MKHRRTNPKTPDAWLVTSRKGVWDAFPRRDDPILVAMVDDWQKQGRSADVVLDHPSLDVFGYGIRVTNPSWLTVRDNWFERYEGVLDGHLRDPRVAQVFTLERGELLDPLTTHKSSPGGPFPLPKGTPWPHCGFCQKPLGFLGVLDFREFRDVPVPKGSLVLHICTDCGACGNPEAWRLHWIMEGEPVEIHGDRTKDVLVGTRWYATEYPIPAAYAEKAEEGLASSGPFLHEHSIYFNFACFADKVGGQTFFIQEEPGLTDSKGEPMAYIGQFVGTDEIPIGDCGIAYVYYSRGTGETTMYPEWF